MSANWRRRKPPLFEQSRSNAIMFPKGLSKRPQMQCVKYHTDTRKWLTSFERIWTNYFNRENVILIKCILHIVKEQLRFL